MYNIIITGNLIDGHEQETALESMASTFKIPLEKANAIFKQSPIAIKKNVDETQAGKFKKVLHSIGLEALIEPNKSEPQANEPEAPAVQQEPTEVAREAQPPASGMDEDTEKHDAIAEQVANEQTSGQAAEETFKGYTYTIEGQPDYSFVTVQLPANETLKVEASAMATMDTNMVMKTKAKGGVGRLVSGESIFINEFTAENGPGEIGIAAGAPGDLKHVYLDDEIIYLQNSAFVASAMDVITETKWQGLTKGFFSGESLFLIRCSGVGDLWFNTYGAMIEIDVKGDYVVDTGNIVAFTDGLDYNITKVGGYKSLFFSGEGFVCRFSGEGKVWIQTRGTSAFTAWAHWYRPVKKKGGLNIFNNLLSLFSDD